MLLHHRGRIKTNKQIVKPEYGFSDLLGSVDPNLLWLDHSPATKTRTVVRWEPEIWIY